MSCLSLLSSYAVTSSNGFRQALPTTPDPYTLVRGMCDRCPRRVGPTIVYFARPIARLRHWAAMAALTGTFFLLSLTWAISDRKFAIRPGNHNVSNVDVDVDWRAPCGCARAPGSRRRPGADGPEPGSRRRGRVAVPARVSAPMLAGFASIVRRQSVRHPSAR